MPANPEFKIKITKDEKDIQKLLEDAGKVADRVAEFQRQIEDHGSVFPGAEKSYAKAIDKANKYYEFLNKKQKSFDKERDEQQKKYWEQAGKVVGTRVGLSPAEQNQQQTEIARMLFTTSDFNQKSLSMAGMVSKLRQAAGPQEEGGIPSESKNFLSSPQFAQSISRGISTAMSGGGMGGFGGASGLLRTAGPAGILAAIGAFAFSSAGAYGDFRKQFEQMVEIPSGRFTSSTARGSMLDRLTYGNIAGYGTPEEAMMSYAGLYRSGMKAQDAEKLYNRSIEMNRLGWGSVEQMGQFRGRMGYLGAKGSDFFRQMEMYRTMSGNMAPEQLMTMMSGAYGMVSSSTGMQVNSPAMMGVLQAMARTGLAQGTGELGMQTLQAFQSGMTGGIGKQLLVKEYAGQGKKSYSEILAQIDKGVSDAQNINMMKSIVTKSAGGDKERENILYRTYFNLNQGQIDELRSMGKIGKGAAVSQKTIDEKMEQWSGTYTGVSQMYEQVNQAARLAAGGWTADKMKAIREKGQTLWGKAKTGEQIDQGELDQFNKEAEAIRKALMGEGDTTNTMNVKAQTVIITTDGKPISGSARNINAGIPP